MHTHTVHKLMSVCNFDLRPELRKMISRESLAVIVADPTSCSAPA